MAHHPTKLTLSLVKAVADMVEHARSELVDVQAKRATYETINPDTAGTVLAGGQEAQLLGLINSLDSVLNGPVADWAIANRDPMYPGRALDGA